MPENPNDYMSPEWRAFRKAHIKPVCEACGFVGPKLHLHHRRYRSFQPIGTWEKPEDVITLCKVCHRVLHPVGSGQGRGYMPTALETDGFIRAVQASKLPRPLSHQDVLEIKRKSDLWNGITGHNAPSGKPKKRRKRKGQRAKEVERLRKLSGHPVLGQMAASRLREIESGKVKVGKRGRNV